ncbi:MAG: DUF4136 domain-containing protein [Phycisphaerae bacterium]|nr:DUF4136 domain-containing protein [Phycisphaerae bacterium]
MTRHDALLGLLAVVGLNGCSTMPMDVRSAHAPEAEFPRRGDSYAWLSMPGNRLKDPRIDPAKLDARVKGAVESELAAKGYVKTETGSPVFLVGYHAVLAESLKPSIIAKKYGIGAGLWGDSLGPDFEKGTLIIDVVSPKTRKLIWRGLAETEVDLSVQDAEKDRRSAEAVRRILEQFPPK